ncbi:hypothetical protein B0H19DRAFT_1084011 [Mycena capillaripes]|nr:hypothetical protein B0H19DRAFT_1084011 [Mycena capillaripes]
MDRHQMRDGTGTLSATELVFRERELADGLVGLRRVVFEPGEGRCHVGKGVERVACLRGVFADEDREDWAAAAGGEHFLVGDAKIRKEQERAADGDPARPLEHSDGCGIRVPVAAGTATTRKKLDCVSAQEIHGERPMTWTLTWLNSQFRGFEEGKKEMTHLKYSDPEGDGEEEVCGGEEYETDVAVRILDFIPVIPELDNTSLGTGAGPSTGRPNSYTVELWAAGSQLDIRSSLEASLFGDSP